ncbi:MAG: tetratricopeptide repeat protein [Bacteroidetes bacterium]|nr:tetratricopeptide repeat protein [Bacteroidota bacterium]
MKKIYPLIFLFFFCTHAFPQSPVIDSLNKMLMNAESDTNTVNSLIKLSIIYSSNDIDSALLYADKAMAMSKEIDDQAGLAKSMYCEAMAISYTGNDARALELHLAALKIFENENQKEWMARGLIEISGMYSDLNDFHDALSYSQRAYHLSKTIQSPEQLFEAAYNNGYSYIKLNKPDSALVYFQESYQIALSAKNDTQRMLGQALGGMGLVNFKLGNGDIAKPYLYKAIQYSTDAYDTYYLMFNYDFLAQVYAKENNTDSAISYYNKALNIAHKLRYGKEKLDLYKPLAMLYEKTDPQMAITYFKLESALRDSLDDAGMQWDIQNLTYHESQRQKDLQEQEALKEKQRRDDMEYSGIALIFIICLIAFLLLSRSIIVHEKAIEYLGIIVLLIFFEFINLMLHPFLEDVTHHSPILMLAGLVLVAAIIIPFHHRLEKYIKSKVIEKNKKLRLLLAKKTIARMEKPTEE